MNYQTKRVLGTLVATAIILFVWALITGTAHAQSRASIFTTAQLFQALPQAMRGCSIDHTDSPECRAVSSIQTELIKRGAVRDSATPVMDKLRVLITLNELCVRERVCAYDAALIEAAFMQELAANGITPNEYILAYESHFGELAGLATITCPVLVETFATFQQARE